MIKNCRLCIQTSKKALFSLWYLNENEKGNERLGLNSKGEVLKEVTELMITVVTLMVINSKDDDKSKK